MRMEGMTRELEAVGSLWYNRCAIPVSGTWILHWILHIYFNVISLHFSLL